MRSLNSFLNGSMRLGWAVVVPLFASLLFALSPAVLAVEDVAPQASVAEDSEKAIAGRASAAVEAPKREKFDPSTPGELSPAALKRIEEEHARHLAVESKLLTLESDLKSLSLASDETLETLSAARSAALKSDSLSVKVDALEATRAALLSRLATDPGLAPLIERQVALKAEVAALAESRQDLMLKMQREGISAEIRTSLASAANRASVARRELARLTIEIESKQDALCETDESAKALKADLLEQERLLKAALAEVPEVAALEAKHKTLKARTREVTSQRVETRKQIKTECACRKPKT